MNFKISHLIDSALDKPLGESLHDDVLDLVDADLALAGDLLEWDATLFGRTGQGNLQLNSFFFLEIMIFL